MPPRPRLTPEAVLRGHAADVQAAAFGGPRWPGLLYTGDFDGVVRVWRLDDRRPACERKLHSAEGGVLGLALAPGVPALLTQGRDGTLRAWRLSADGLLPPDGPPARALDVRSLSYCPLALLDGGGVGWEEGGGGVGGEEAGPSGRGEGKAAPSGGVEGGAAAEAAVGGSVPVAAEAAAVGGGGEAAADAAHATPLPRGRTLVALGGGDPGTVEVWDVGAAARVARLALPAGAKSRGMVMALAWLEWGAAGGAPDGAAVPTATRAVAVPADKAVPQAVRLLVGYEDGTAILWDPVARVAVAEARLHADAIMTLAAARDGSVGVSGAADDALAFFAATPTSLARTGALRLPSSGLGAVAVQSATAGCPARVAAGGWDGALRVAAPGPPAAALGAGAYHGAAIAAAAFQEETGLLATGGRDGMIALWRIGCGEGGDERAGDGGSDGSHCTSSPDGDE